MNAETSSIGGETLNYEEKKIEIQNKIERETHKCPDCGATLRVLTDSDGKPFALKFLQHEGKLINPQLE